MKESQIGSATPQYNPITLEIVRQDPQDADPALIHAVGRDTSAALGNDGYVIEPLYTNQRSGFLVEVTPLLNTVAADIWAQKDIILGDLSALVTILSAAVPIIKHLRKAYEKRVEKQSMRQEPIKITIEIDGSPILIEVPDVENAEGILKLAQHIQANHPIVAGKVTPQSKLNIKGHVPKRSLPKRR